MSKLQALQARVIDFEGTKQVQFVGLATLKQAINDKWLEYTKTSTGETKRYKLVSTEIGLPNGQTAPLTCQIHEKSMDLMADSNGEFTKGENYLVIMTRVESNKKAGEFVNMGILSHLQGESTDNAAINDAYADMFAKAMESTTEKVGNTL